MFNNNDYVSRMGTAHVKNFSFQPMVFYTLFDYLSAQLKSLEWWALPTLKYVD
jgi:hypothetical protein